MRPKGTSAPAPQSIEAEVSVLGGVIGSRDALVEARRILRPDDFYREAHGKVFAACLDLFERNQPVDLVTLANELMNRKQLEAVGGATFLHDLVEKVPTAANIVYHAGIVKDASTRRELISACGRAAENARAGKEFAVVLAEHRKSLQALGRMEAALEFPEPTLAPEALQGLAGEIVTGIAPHTEADPAAILAHILGAFGNVIGSGPHFLVEFTKHHMRLNFGLVGKTAKARKGQAWSAPRHLFQKIDSAWAKNCITSGLSSGEGLIYRVRDEKRESRPVRDDGQVKRYEEVIVDRGVRDKRLLVVEEELAQALKVMSREGNILSPTIRQAWDSGDLHPLTKNNPLQATGAHISIIGHITGEELARHLTETEQANGFANRFIWMEAKRSRFIPIPEGVPRDVMSELQGKLKNAVAFARDVGKMTMDQGGEGLWVEMYRELSEGKPGLLGAITARAEAQVRRLACLYALLDQSAQVGRPHLKAALALWDFSEASVLRIFGDRLGHQEADRIVVALRAARGDWVSRTEIRDLFDRHCPAERIDAGLDLLVRAGLAESASRETGGRPQTIWRATKAI